MYVRLKSTHPGNYVKERVNGVYQLVDKRWKEFDDGFYSELKNRSVLEFREVPGVKAMPPQPAPKVEKPVEKEKSVKTKKFNFEE